MSAFRDYLGYAGKALMPVALALSVANMVSTQENKKVPVKERVTEKKYNNNYTTVVREEDYSVPVTAMIRGPGTVVAGERVEYWFHISGLFTDEVKLAVGIEKECGGIGRAGLRVATPVEALNLPEGHKVGSENFAEVFRDELDDMPGWVGNSLYSKSGAKVTEGDIRESNEEWYRTSWREKISPLSVTVPIVFKKSGYVKASVFYNIDGEFFTWSDMLFVEVE